MPTDRRGPATLDTLARQLESLQRHIDNLDKSIQQLFTRLNEDENRPRVPVSYPPSKIAETPTLQIILATVREADAHVESMERDLSYLRHKIETLDTNPMLADEIRSYLKPKRPDQE